MPYDDSLNWVDSGSGGGAGDPLYDPFLMQAMNLSETEGMGGGGFWSDPSLIPGYYNVMGDGNGVAWSDINGGTYVVPPDPSLTQGYGYVPYDPSPIGTTLDQTGIDPSGGTGTPSDPYTFSTDAYGTSSDPGYAPNPGYDPGSINNLPYDPAYNNPDLYPDPSQMPTGGTGTPNDPYTFSTDATGQMPTDTATPPPTRSQYPPPGTMTQGGPIRTPPTTTPSPTTQPPQNSGLKPPAPRASSSPTQSSNFAFNMGGLPGIASAVPSNQPFQYQPISIARQGAPNAGLPSYDPMGQQGGFGQSGLGGPMGAFSTLNPYARLKADQQKQNTSSIYDSGL